MLASLLQPLERLYDPGTSNAERAAAHAAVSEQLELLVGSGSGSGGNSGNSGVGGGAVEAVLHTLAGTWVNLCILRVLCAVYPALVLVLVVVTYLYWY